MDEGHGELCEGFLYVDVLLGTDFHEETVVGICEDSALLEGDLPLVLQVAFVADDEQGQFVCSILFELVDPVFDFLEGFSVVDGVD